jgi:hypothetical protein
MEWDRQMRYYTDVACFTNLYGTSKFGMAGTYSLKFKPVSLEEIVHFDGIVHHHGVQGGGPRIHLCWDPTDSDYDDTRFLQIKRMYKLNNNFLVPKFNQHGYNLAYRYDMIYEAPIHNTNRIFAAMARMRLSTE